MDTTNVRVRYRPVRIGWCIRDGNWEDLRRVLRLTHVFWGGKFNPIIPVEAPHAEDTVRRFRVDILVDICEDKKIEAFKDGFKYLPWPLLEPALFSRSSDGLIPNFLDVSTVLVDAAEMLPESSRDRDNQFAMEPEKYPYAIVHCDDNDPLNDVMLATFGAYPTHAEIDRDYTRFITENINPFHYWPKQDGVIPACLLDQATPNEISARDLNWDRIPYPVTLGYYAGSATSFEDILNYWNLRAAGLSLLFLDPSYSERLAKLRESHTEFILTRHSISERQGKNQIPIWSRSPSLVKELNFPEEMVPYFHSIDSTDVTRGALTPTLNFFSRRTMLASLSQRHREVALAFQLPEKPFQVRDSVSGQHFIVATRNPFMQPDAGRTFWTPYCPELNPWYGRALFLSSRTARSEVDGIAMICPVTIESITVSSFGEQELTQKLFELAGIEARPSVPGRIAARLISQLGGLQGCRVLKVAGVRKLIKQYGPLGQFDRTEAIRLIGNTDPVTHQPRFSEYEELYIEQREPGTKLKPHDVFLYLLEKRVFRVGLSLKCPNCELHFWVHLDDLSTLINCELCGKSFDITRQLKDRSWTYRRSGLFGQENNQEGGIPVALTLQQLHTHLGTASGSMFLTNMSLSPLTAHIAHCETDIFVALSAGDKIQIAVGECKDAGGQIELDDAKKLAAVADAFPPHRFEPFIIFSKTAPFTPDEIENCRAAQMAHSARVILLSDRELEPYRLYEKTAKEFAVRQSASSLEEMARITHEVYFSPKPK